MISICHWALRRLSSSSSSHFLRPSLTLHKKKTLFDYYPRIPASIMTSSEAVLPAAVVCFQESSDDSKVCKLSMQVQNPQTGASKQINMCRKADEQMGDFLQRLKASLAKMAAKGVKGKKKKQAEENTSVEVSFFKEGGGLADPMGMSAQDFFSQPGLRIQLDAPLDRTYQVLVNPPMVVRGKFSDTVLSGFPFYPSRLEYENAKSSKTKFEWFVSSEKFKPNEESEASDSKKRKAEAVKNMDKMTWVKKSEGFIFTPEDGDVHSYVKVVCTPVSSDGSNGIPFELISSSSITQGPKNCPFESRHAFAPSCSSENGFRVLTYNLLADLYANSDFSRTVLHPQCPPWALEISYRKLVMLKELAGYRADILCLQEVDEKIFEHDLKPVLRQMYKGVFSRKAGQVSEGLACFWNPQKFRLVDTDRQVVHENLYPEILSASNDQLRDRLSKRTTVLKTIVLECLSSQRKVLVGITHLYFKPDADHIRLLQAAVCMRILEEKLSRLQAQSPGSTLILAGDFNSTPPFGVLEFIRKGVIREDHADWLSCPGEEVKGLSIRHSQSMESACGTPEYTTYTQGFSDCIDYIFYQTDRLAVKSVLPFPLKEELEGRQGIPHIDCPSDHIACVADMEWIQ